MPGPATTISVTTFGGVLAAAVLVSGLLERFGGQGLVSDILVSDPLFLAAVGIGAANTSLLATRFGFTVSTTHALVGAGLAGGGSLEWWALGRNFVMPLVVGPDPRRFGLVGDRLLPSGLRPRPIGRPRRP